MVNDRISSNTRVSRLVIAYSLCEEAEQSHLILTTRVTRAMLYASIVMYYSVAERDVLEHYLEDGKEGMVVGSDLPLKELCSVYDKFKEIRNKAIAHVDEGSPAYQLDEESGWFLAPPGVSYLAQQKVGGVQGRVHIAYSLPDIDSKDRMAFKDLTAVTADIYYQIHTSNWLDAT